MPPKDRLYVNERPWLTALAFVGGIVIAAGIIWLLDGAL